MTSEQALTIEQLAKRTHSTDADLLWLARLCSGRDADIEIADMHMGDLNRADAAQMIETLQAYERVMIQVEAAHYRLRMCAYLLYTSAHGETQSKAGACERVSGPGAG